jgi:hypothetical protein
MMKIVGRRFLTWMSVWALSFLVKGELAAAPQDRPTESVTSGTPNTGHKVPLLKTQSLNKQKLAQVRDKSSTNVSQSPTTETALIPGVGKISRGLKTTSRTTPSGHKTHAHKSPK